MTPTSLVCHGSPLSLPLIRHACHGSPPLAAVQVESSDTCPKPLENYCQSTGVINIGFYKSHVVLKEKYLGFQPSTSSDSSAEAVSIRPASMEAAGTTESRLNDAIMLLVNVAHLFGIHPATVVAWHKLHWDQLSTGKRNEGKFAKVRACV